MSEGDRLAECFTVRHVLDEAEEVVGVSDELSTDGQGVHPILVVGDSRELEHLSLEATTRRLV